MKNYNCSVLTKVSKEYPRKIAMRLEALEQTTATKQMKRKVEKEKPFTLNGRSTWKEMAKPQADYEKAMLNKRMNTKKK